MAQSLRKTAVNILLNIEKNGAYINAEMNKLRASKLYDARDIRLIGEIVNGVIKHKISIDYVISLHSSVKIKKIAPYVLNVLRIGVCQILFMDKIPQSAAVDESVKLIKKSSVSRLSGYVNAVLRAVKPDDLSSLSGDKYEVMSVKYSYPLWLAERWAKEFGDDFSEELMQSLNKKSPLFIRRCANRTSPCDFLKELKACGINISEVKYDDFPDFNYCYRIDGAKELSSIPGFCDSRFYIQDPTAALAGYLVGAKRGDRVIDLCAAPGGKSLFMAELMGDEGEVISCDIYEHKLKLIAENAEKYNLKSIKPCLNDASILREEWINTADCVLCDVPCTGFGIIRKKPDIKYSRREEDIESLSKLSLSILSNASEYLKAGGTLLFSTCTIEKEENEKTVEAFLAEHKDFSICPIGSGKYYTSYPNITDSDGFFVCKLIKNGVK